jgi:hypothetical protein
MSEEQLQTEITLKSVRHIQLRETDGTTKPDGWRIFAGHLVRLFKEEFAQYIEYSKMDEERLVSLAKVWAVQLEPEYVLYGVDGIRAAMRSYVADDASVYYRFPKVGQIKAACTELKGSPEHELGLREQAKEEARLEAEHQAALDAFRVKHPEEWKRIQEEAARRYEAQNGRRAQA